MGDDEELRGSIMSLRVFLVATLVYPECLGLFYLRALKALGCQVDVWDPRRIAVQPELRNQPDLTIVIKEFVNPRTLPQPRVYIFPDQVKHENYGLILNSITPSYDQTFFCMKHPKEIMKQYNAHLLPFAIDDQIHRPMPEVSKNIDVSFVGTNRPGRMELMRFLNSQGVAVQIWGNSWPKETPNYMGEAIYLDNKRYVYNSSKIVLNHHYLKIGWNMRFIETLAMKAFQLVDQPIPNPFDGFFNVGQDFIIYDDAKQCAELIRYYLTNSEEREKIMLSGYTRCLRGGHTYRDRVKSILEMV